MYYAQRSALTKRSRDVLILLIILLLVALVATAGFCARSAQRDSRASEVLLDNGANELGQAKANMSQLSRVGGSNTTQQISQLRQHLYAIERLNAITTELYGENSAIISETTLARALETVAKCESRLLQGQAIDEQLQSLRVIIEEMDVKLRRRKS